MSAVPRSPASKKHTLLGVPLHDHLLRSSSSPSLVDFGNSQDHSRNVTTTTNTSDTESEDEDEDLQGLGESNAGLSHSFHLGGTGTGRGRGRGGEDEDESNNDVDEYDLLILNNNNYQIAKKHLLDSALPPRHHNHHPQMSFDRDEEAATSFERKAQGSFDRDSVVVRQRSSDAVLKQKSIQCVYEIVGGQKVAKSLKIPFSKPLEAENREPAKPRWPSELQFIRAPQFIAYSPRAPLEPMLKADGPIFKLIKRIPENGRLVYDSSRAMNAFFVKGSLTTDRYSDLAPCYTPSDENDSTLIFESRFESANLEKAYQASLHTYNLYLRRDLYTDRHTQWFYFRVSHLQKDTTYTFNIVNLLKSSSLYSNGMRPLVYSVAKAKEGVGWVREGFDIDYSRNDITMAVGGKERPLFTLSFKYTATEDKDTVYFAHCYPYTYSDLQDYLVNLRTDPERSLYVKHRILCKTLAGNNCDLLTITSFGCSEEEMKSRKGVVVSARVHPGETNSSYMMKGVIDFLTGPSQDAKILREHFVFKIVPMLNPDGVIVGNYRCSLAGVDLNRTYKQPHMDVYPTVFHLKTMMKRFAEDRPVIAFCDLHGHSKKQNIFMYGCNNDKGRPPPLFLTERVLPLMLSLNGKGHFSYKSCRFAVQKQKESTGRIATWRELGILNSLTMEASFCGSTIGQNAGFHFSQGALEEMGAIFCDTLLDYCDPDNSKVQYLLSKMRHEYYVKMAANGGLPPPSNDDDSSSSAASDSSESEGEIQATVVRSVKELTRRVLINKGTEPAHSATSAPPEPAKKKKKVKQPKKKRAASLSELDPAPTHKGKAPHEERTKSKEQQKPLRVRHVSKYDLMSGNGMPLFSEARIEERRQQAIERRKTRMEEQENTDFEEFGTSEDDIFGAENQDGVFSPRHKNSVLSMLLFQASSAPLREEVAKDPSESSVFKPALESVPAPIPSPQKTPVDQSLIDLPPPDPSVGTGGNTIKPASGLRIHRKSRSASLGMVKIEHSPHKQSIDLGLSPPHSLLAQGRYNSYDSVALDRLNHANISTTRGQNTNAHPSKPNFLEPLANPPHSRTIALGQGHHVLHHAGPHSTEAVSAIPAQIFNLDYLPSEDVSKVAGFSPTMLRKKAFKGKQLPGITKKI